MKRLTPERVHIARTGGFTDTHLARVWGVGVDVVFRARTGLSHKDHPTPPDTTPRLSVGRSGHVLARRVAA